MFQYMLRQRIFHRRKGAYENRLTEFREGAERFQNEWLLVFVGHDEDDTTDLIYPFARLRYVMLCYTHSSQNQSAHGFPDVDWQV